eukprot:gnl/TRDRNA2_/TRDRNA2_82208_c1_seq1.p1 gnl/TRDRNA2_/TRDRNA2_82208_c1~~gnl/TRDRNA2_/TRDRNA2_82208_c1_seq1.p1  ORF type:complete len:711 (-),score=124.71 gnl/TRDRNA2_/TRDRNA2_82208_c1_seq1:8-1936(-)
MDAAHTWLSALRKSGRKPDIETYTILISGFAKSGDLRKAQNWLAKMRSAAVMPNTVTYTTIISACAKRRDVTRAEQLLDEMREDGLEPTDAVFNAVIDVHAGDRSPRGAEAALREMLLAKVSPGLVSYGAVTKAAARAGDLARAEAWVARTVVAGWEPDARMYYALLSACAQVGDLEAADHCAARMHAAGIASDVISHTAIIGACATAGDLLEAKRRLAAMEDEGLKPNAFTFNAMINTSIAAGSTLDTEHWLFQLARLGEQQSALLVGFNGVLRPWAAQGDVLRVEAWMIRMATAEVVPDVISHNTAINACAVAGDSAASQRAFERILAQRLRPSLATYRALVKPFAREGNYEAVSAALQRMRSDGLARDAFCDRALISACANAQPPAADVAEAAFREAADSLRGDSYAMLCLVRAIGPDRLHRLEKELDLGAAATSVLNRQDATSTARRYSQASSPAHAAPATAAAGLLGTSISRRARRPVGFTLAATPSSLIDSVADTQPALAPWVPPPLGARQVGLFQNSNITAETAAPSAASFVVTPKARESDPRGLAAASASTSIGKAAFGRSSAGTANVSTQESLFVVSSKASSGHPELPIEAPQRDRPEVRSVSPISPSPATRVRGAFQLARSEEVVPRAMKPS